MMDNDENIGRKLFQLIHPDGCWHEWPTEPGVIACVKCSADYTYQPNPSYSSSISDAMAAVGEAVRQNQDWKVVTETDRHCASVVIQKWYLLKDRYAPLIAQVDHESLPTAITLALIEALEAKP